MLFYIVFLGRGKKVCEVVFGDLKVGIIFRRVDFCQQVFRCGLGFGIGVKNSFYDIQFFDIKIRMVGVVIQGYVVLGQKGCGFVIGGIDLRAKVDRSFLLFVFVFKVIQVKFIVVFGVLVGEENQVVIGEEECFIINSRIDRLFENIRIYCLFFFIVVESIYNNFGVFMVLVLKKIQDSIVCIEIQEYIVLCIVDQVFYRVYFLLVFFIIGSRMVGKNIVIELFGMVVWYFIFVFVFV